MPVRAHVSPPREIFALAGERMGAGICFQLPQRI